MKARSNMSKRDEFLKIRSYEECDKRKHEFENLDFHDKEIEEKKRKCYMLNFEN